MLDALTTLAVGAASLLAGLLGPNHPPPPPVAAPPIVASPASGVKGTVVMVHGGGWRGFDPLGQKALMEQPGELFLERGWRVVSIDYGAGAEGLQDLVDAVDAELGAPTGQLLCLYGESAGAHLALLAAAKLDAVDCVMAAGPPTDLVAYQAEARASGDRNRSVIAGLMQRAFGTTADAVAPWEPVRVAQSLSADVLMLRQAGDLAVPREQIERYVAADPSAQSAELESTTEVNTKTWWLHGTLSDSGRSNYFAELGGFADRAVSAHRAERRAVRSGCQGTLRPISASRSDRALLAEGLTCLARRDASVKTADAAWTQTTKLRVLGRVNAARVWAALRRQQAGRRALAALGARRASTTVNLGDPTRVSVVVER